MRDNIEMRIEKTAFFQPSTELSMQQKNFKKCLTIAFHSDKRVGLYIKLRQFIT